VTVVGTVAEALQVSSEVFVEYTGAAGVGPHVRAALAAGRHVVVGSSGLTSTEYDEIDAAARERGVGVIAVGNFALSAALLQRFAAEAARYFPAWEIVDFASAGKVDAPSGTARELAWRLAQEGAPELAVPLAKTLGERDSRGATLEGSQVHSLRLPGTTIGLEIHFGREDERLVLRYDGGPGAQPYIAGTLLAIRKVTEIVGLVRGLDRLL